jgi:pSer/pThr/pTyr-binding forkhead associated (FHA) protein
MIKSSGELATIVDMGSANGTRVNGSRIVREQVLREGDIIQIGKTLLRFAGNDSA